MKRRHSEYRYYTWCWSLKAVCSKWTSFRKRKNTVINIICCSVVALHNEDVFTVCFTCTKRVNFFITLYFVNIYFKLYSLTYNWNKLVLRFDPEKCTFSDHITVPADNNRLCVLAETVFFSFVQTFSPLC